MRRRWLLVAGLVLPSVAASSGSVFTGMAAVSDDAVLTFRDERVGSIRRGDPALRYTAAWHRGLLLGEGLHPRRRPRRHGDSVRSLVGTFSADGTTDEGKPITLSSGPAFSPSGITLTRGSSGSATGTFCLVVQVEGTRIELQERARASGSGELVKPDDPYTLQMAGEGSIELETSPLQSPELASTLPPARQGLPWDPRTWSQDLQAELLRLLGRAEQRQPRASPAGRV